MTTRIIRDKIMKHLNNDVYFNGMMTSEEINGTHFSAIDIALAESEKKVHVFRLMLIKHG